MKLIYAKSEYIADNSLAIMSYTDEDGWLEPYGPVTVCLAGYGLKPAEGCVYMPTYKMMPDFVNQVIDDIVYEVLGIVQIGYGEGLYVKLWEDWENNVEMCEWV